LEVIERKLKLDEKEIEKRIIDRISHKISFFSDDDKTVNNQKVMYFTKLAGIEKVIICG
jgi:hypothetical protein